MHLYGTNYPNARQHHGGTVIETSDPDMLTLTALVAPISMTSFPTIGVEHLHALEESVCFHVEASKIPSNIRCSCLKQGRFCLVAEHWLLEFGTGSPFWLGEDGLPRAGSLIRYVGPKHGHKSIVIDEFGERICCVEGYAETKPEEGSVSSLLTG